jgi:peptidoglycan/xylan/chitin deacetylase (PgdA/CDA1 family)
VILDILQEHNVKATFFVLGTEAKKYPEILHRIYAAGHAIGNHSYNHVYRELYQSATTYFEQIYKNDQVIFDTIGVRPRITRAPGGAAGSFTREYWDRLKTDGYVDVGWNISSGDASRAKAPQLISNIRHQLDNKFLWSHAIVLMHDGTGHAATVQALPEIIDMFKNRGFEFRVVNLETPPAW